MSLHWNSKLVALPEIRQFASLVEECSTRETLMMILEVWDLFEEMSADGRIRHLRFGALSTMLDDTPDAFWTTLLDLGWIMEDGDDVTIPLYNADLEQWLMRRREQMRAFVPRPSIARGMTPIMEPQAV